MVLTIISDEYIPMNYPSGNYQVQINKSLYNNKETFIDGAQSITHELYSH
jgi:hypothetical protein